MEKTINIRTLARPRIQADGFSLLEIIVTITIAAILGTIIILFMGTSLTRSAESVTGLKDTADLVSDIEALTLDYRHWLATPALGTAWSDFGTIVNNTSAYPHVDAAASGTISISSADGFTAYRVTMRKNGQSIETLFTRNGP